MSKNGGAVVPEVRKIIEETKRKKAEILSLELSNLKIGKFSPQLKKLIEQLYNLQVLVLNECSLTSLQNFPALQNLQRIDLTSNQITDGEVKHLRRYKKLKIANLASNAFTGKCLEQLQQLRQLQQLELYQNKICEEDNYRQLVFQSIKALKILDGEDRYGLIIESEEDYDEDQVEERNVVEDEESDEDWDNDHLDNDGEEQPEAFQDELNLAEDTEAPKAAKPPKPKHSRPGRPRKNAHPKT